jgi:hypothetical protein
MNDIKTSRRQFLAIGATAVAAAAVVPRIARAQGALPQIDEADPTAAALGYKHDSAKVDAAKYPSHKPTQACAELQAGTGRRCRRLASVQHLPRQVGQREGLVRRLRGQGLIDAMRAAHRVALC